MLARIVAPVAWRALAQQHLQCVLSRSFASPAMREVVSLSTSTRLEPWASGSRGMHSSAVDKQVDDINALFVEARDEIEMAREEAETVYFNESVELARKATEEVLTRWAALLSGLPEAERGKMVRSMGMKIEQLKAELKELENLHG